MRGVWAQASQGRSAWLAGLGGLFALTLVGGLAGCASSATPRRDLPPDEVVATLPARHPPDVISDTAATLRRYIPDTAGEEGPHSGRADTALYDCACTLEYRMNLCVTVNGTSAFSDRFAGVSFARVREGGAADTLSAADVAEGGRCFGEWRGLQRVLMLRESAVVDSSGWFEVQTVDCCHGEAKTVDFRR